MLFNSYEFIFVFLPITFFIFFYLNEKRLIVASKAFLVFASLFFYAWWNVIYLPLILISMIFNYTIGKNLTDSKNKKFLLTFGIVVNILLLAYFKYSDFFIQNINLITHSHIHLLHLALPLAISFFTFQQISYLVDSYKNETKEYNFLNYALFVTFFPQLIAGPIVHHKEMMPQFSKISNLAKNYRNIALGLFIFTIGLFKKVVIADSFAFWANAGFDEATTLNFLEAWITSLSYTFELYFDFSGYTDMAIGVALLFNIKLPINFNSPYKAVSIQDFWRRWHITLSRFLRDYIYIPLGGNRLGEFRVYNNLMITFLIGGLWHGAGWTFVFWGFLHGLALIIHRIWQKVNIKLNNFIAWFITFNFINISWVFFRAKTWDDAIKVLKGMFTLKDNIILPTALEDKVPALLTNSLNIKYDNFLVGIHGGVDTILWIIVGFVLVLFCKNSNEIAKEFKPNLFYALFASVLIFYISISMGVKSEFLYFNF